MLGDVLESTCCHDIEASGFIATPAKNDFYTFTGTLINGRHLYITKKQFYTYGIWFNGQYGDAAGWVIDKISYLTEGATIRSNESKKDKQFCPSVIKVWQEMKMTRWTNSTTAIVQCLSGNNVNA